MPPSPATRTSGRSMSSWSPSGTWSTGQKARHQPGTAARIRTHAARTIRIYIERLRNALKFLSYASCYSSRPAPENVDKIFPLLESRAGTSQAHRHGRMNRFLKHVDFERASVPMRQRVKILSDAIQRGATDIHPVHRSGGEIALLLPALSKIRFAMRSGLSERRSGSRTERGIEQRLTP